MDPFGSIDFFAVNPDPVSNSVVNENIFWVLISELDEIRLYPYNWIGGSRNINHSNFWHNAATK